jgi:sugar lactone lactonase YvrE
MGDAPAYTNRTLTNVPNAQAMRTRIWSPRLGDGWVPQGVAVGGGFLWVAAYQSIDPKQDRGPCRVFQIDPTDGGVAGQFALPAACGHAGGIAHTGDRYLYVADTRLLIRIDTQAALAAGQCEPLGCSTIPLSGNLRGSALGFRQGVLWLVSYVKAGDGTGRAWRVPEQKVLALIAKGGGTLDQTAADRELRIADQTQGAAVAADGTVWLTQSSGEFGRLQQIDRETGQVMTSYTMPAGIEDIEFGPDGRLWAVSEAGSRRWNAWSTFFPLVFSLEMNSLR